MDISKSSFYHLFADVEVFVNQLLLYHMERAEMIAAKERSAKTIDPDLILILLDHKTDLLFNRQLRINTNHPNYGQTLARANQIMGKDFVNLWLRDTKLQMTLQQSESLFELALEHFFLQINADALNEVGLQAYFDSLTRLARHFAKAAVR